MKELKDKKTPYAELLQLADLLDHDEWVKLDEVYGILENVCDLDDLKGNHIKRLKKIIKDTGCQKSIKTSTQKGVKGFEGLKDLCANWKRRYLIPESLIEFVTGNVNYDLLNLIQHEIQERGKMDIKPFISIGNDDKSQRDYILKFAEAIMEKKALYIEYEPFFMEDGKTDLLEFSPEFIRRIGDQKWMVYGISKSHFFGDEKYVNLVFNRIKEIRKGEGLIYKPSGIDYANQPFGHQVTFHAIQPESAKLLDNVVIKVRKKKEGYQQNIPFYPFKRIQREPLHASQEVLKEDEHYGYITIKVLDAVKLKPILLGWGSDLEVLQPESLRKVMLEEVDNMKKCYSSNETNECIL